MHRRTIGALERHARRHVRIACLFQIASGDDGQHARHFCCRRCIDFPDLAMRDRRPHHGSIGLTLQIDVIRILALALDQPHILITDHRLANAKLHGGKTFVINTHVH